MLRYFADLVFFSLILRSFPDLAIFGNCSLDFARRGMTGVHVV